MMAKKKNSSAIYLSRPQVDDGDEPDISHFDSIKMADPDLLPDVDQENRFIAGPRIGKDGKYNCAVDLDLHKYVCPCCERDWPESPDVYVWDNIVWVEGNVLRMRYPRHLSIFTALLENFGRWMKPEILCDVAFSDWPDADTPDRRQLIHQVLTVNRRLYGSPIMIQADKALGYRLTRCEIARASRKRFKEQIENETMTAAKVRLEYVWKRLREEKKSARKKRMQRIALNQAKRIRELKEKARAKMEKKNGT